jgi:phosphoglycerate kinase
VQLAKEKGVRFLLPLDILGAEEIKTGAATRHSGRISPTYNIPDGWQAVDIGPLTIALFKSEIARAKTILWNGPPGIFEIQEFSAGTEAIAEALAESKATTIIGGGDSVTAVTQAGLADKMTFISTGGGASLELIEGKELPGVAGLSDRV